jgi:hypothetical protein
MPSKSWEHWEDLSLKVYRLTVSTGAISLLGDYPLVLNCHDSVTFGTNILGWKYRIKHGLSATTTMEGQREVVNRAWGNVVAKTTFNANFPPASQIIRQYYTQGYPLQTNLSSYAGNESEAFNQARSEFLSKARKAQTAFQGGVFLGELAKTIRGIRHPFETFKRAGRDYLSKLERARKGFGRLAPNKREYLKSKVLTDSWLETQYAWAPLLSDIDGACEALGEFAFRDDSQVVRGKGIQETFHSVGTSVLPIGGGMELWYDVITKSRAEVRYIGKVRIYANSELGYTKQNFGLSLSNFLPTIWELVPYSFLIDYFTNVGNLIDAYSFPISDVVWVNQTVRRSGLKSTVNPRFMKPTDTASEKYVWLSQDPGLCNTERYTVSRIAANPATLVPDFRITYPGASWKKWLNIGSLLNGFRRITPY